ncbi:MAG: hypothetical protein J6D52_05890 [Clostridia bacterium]|nr:hypothetical protein [Clostridia bacterium]
MRNKYRVLSVILAFVLTVGTVIPATFIALANTRYIDEDCSAKNTYDEEGIKYSSDEIEVDGEISYVTAIDAVGIGEYKLSRHGKLVDNSGVYGSNAIRFYQVRGSSETDKDVSYIRILNSGDSNYNWFVPNAKSKYKVKISYKTNKTYKFVIREVGAFGEIGYDDNTLSVFTNESVEDGWSIASAEFTTDKNTTSIYIAVVTENGERDSEAEVYIDDVAISLPEKIQEYVEGSTYTNTLNVDGLTADGWTASFSSNPQGGVAFSSAKIGDYYESWGKGAANLTRRQHKNLNWSNNWDKSNVFGNMAALTYTAKKYKYFRMTFDYKFDNKNYPWPVVTFNQQSTTPQMFYRTSRGVSNPTYSEDPIGVHFEYEGHINISGKKTGTSRKAANPTLTGTNWHKAEITVTPGKVYIAVFNTDGTVANELTTTLDASYMGGYIALMQNGVNFFRNISVTELIYDNGYSSTLNVCGLDMDGWKASFSSNPQGGVVFTDMTKVGDLYESWGTGAANITRRQGQKEGINSANNWDKANVFGNMGALTYTAQKYKYFTLTVEYKFETKDRPWPIITFNQQGPTPEMFYKTSKGVSNPTYSEDPIGVHFEYEGHINISGVKTGTSRKTASPTLVGTEWHKAQITVTPDGVYVAVFNSDGTVANEYTANLDSSYAGGYISLMQNGVNFFRNISITEIEVFEEVTDNTYNSELKNIDNLTIDGWKASYSANPQAEVNFTDATNISDYYECWSGGITRRQVNINWYNNWNNADTFSKMGALTYTAQKYKYFTMSVEYKYGKKNDSDTNFKNYPRPIITFNQQTTNPQMFYKTSTAVTDPTYSEEPIGVFFEYEGSINVSGKRTGTERKAANSEIVGADWHKAELTVTPGKVYVVIYNDDGTVANEHTVTLSQDYEGGYISLMQNGLNFFRNISITEFEVVDMAQKEDVGVDVVDLDETQIGNTILVSTKTKRGYDFKSVSAVSENGVAYKISEFDTDLYKIEAAKPSRLTVTYEKRELDYDPEYTLKYYFDWEEELGDFTATRSPLAEKDTLEKVEVSDIWKITDNVLTKPNIDYTGTTQTGRLFADTNILMLKDIKFRNFELTLQYKHGKSGGYAGGIIFGIKDPAVFCNEADGGVFAMVESDARATLYGKSLRNADIRIIPGDGVTNLPGYPKWDTKMVHFMKLRVLDGKVEMIVDGANIDDPAIGVLPKDYYGYIALAVANNKGWFDNLTIQPLDEWGNKITLAENEKQSSFNPEDIETDTWIDNSEWE